MSFAICGDFGDFPTLKNLFGSLRKTILNRSRVSEEHLVNAIEDFIYNLTCAIANDQGYDIAHFDPAISLIMRSRFAALPQMSFYELFLLVMPRPAILAFASLDM